MVHEDVDPLQEMTTWKTLKFDCVVLLSRLATRYTIHACSCQRDQPSDIRSTRFHQSFKSTWTRWRIFSTTTTQSILTLYKTHWRHGKIRTALLSCDIDWSGYDTTTALPNCQLKHPCMVHFSDCSMYPAMILSASSCILSMTCSSKQSQKPIGSSSSKSWDSMVNWSMPMSFLLHLTVDWSMISCLCWTSLMQSEYVQ